MGNVVPPDRLATGAITPTAVLANDELELLRARCHDLIGQIYTYPADTSSQHACRRPNYLQPVLRA
jgi:hypothetical protein